MKIIRPESNQPMPKDAKRVFKGEIFEVYQWGQRLFDGKVATFEKAKRADSVSVIPVTPEGKIILAEQEQPGTSPFIGVLGGRIDEGEDPLEAGKRELMEETGCDAKDYKLWFARQLTNKIDWAVYIFIARGVKKVREPELEGGEKIKLIEVTFDEFIRIVAQENYRDLEISLEIFRVINKPGGLESLRKLFGL